VGRNSARWRSRGRSRDYAAKLAEKEQVSSSEAVEQARKQGMQEMSAKFRAMGSEIYEKD
jgi:phosphomethylpyrimidine synthase